MVQESSTIDPRIHETQRSTGSSTSPKLQTSLSTPWSPLSRLPPEALCEIFLQCHSEWDPHLPDIRQAILFVSKHWRSVALSCTKLWDAIVFTTAVVKPYCPPRWFRHLTYKLISPEKDVLISLWATLTDTSLYGNGVNETELSALLKILAPAKGKTVGLKALGIRGQETAARFLASLPTTSVVHLKALVLEGNSFKTEAVYSAFAKSLPRLHSLSFPTFWLPWVISNIRRDCIVYLHMRGYTTPGGGSSNYPNVFPSFRKLQELPEPPALVCFPNLLSLELYGLPAHMTSFLEHIRFPSYTSFTFTAVVDDPFFVEGFGPIIEAYLTSSGLSSIEPNFLALCIDLIEEVAVPHHFNLSIQAGFFRNDRSATQAIARPLINGRLQMTYHVHHDGEAAGKIRRVGEKESVPHRECNGGKVQQPRQGWPPDFSPEAGYFTDETNSSMSDFLHNHAVPRSLSTYPGEVLAVNLARRKELGYPIEHLELESCFDVDEDVLEDLKSSVGKLETAKIHKNPCSALEATRPNPASVEVDRTSERQPTRASLRLYHHHPCWTCPERREYTMSRRWADTSNSKSSSTQRTGVVVPRPFLPPSYYAAAGGIPYPRKQLNPITQDSWPEERPQGSKHATSRLQRLRPPPPPHDHREHGGSFNESRHNDIQETQSSTRTSVGANTSTPKRQGLPNVEADLLPSLQSTIHRMTRPPSRVVAEPVNLPAPIPTVHVSAKRISSHATQIAETPPPVTPAPRAQSRIPQKSALKSALRSTSQRPTPALEEPVSSPTPTPPSPRRNSLKSVKSLLSRKLGATQPRDTPTTPSLSSSHTKLEDCYSQSHHRKPAPAGGDYRHKTQHPPKIVATVHSDESDIESNYQRQWMQRRRLTVINAEVVPSGSSSGSSMNSSYDSLQTPKIGHYTPQTSLTQSDPWKKTKPTTAPNSPMMPSMEYRDERDKAKILRFSLPPSGSDASLYSNHQLSYPGSWGESDYLSERDIKDSYEDSMDASIQNEQSGRGWDEEDGFCGSGSNSSFGTDGIQHHLDARGSTTRQRSVERTAEQRNSRIPERTRPLPRPPSSQRGLPPTWTRPPSEADRSNAWFNESSAEQGDEYSHIPNQPSRRAPAPPGYDATSLAQELRRRAAEQREAFGLPPSDSDDGNGCTSQRWSMSDSYRSSVESARWEWNSRGSGEGPDGGASGSRESLSAGAQNMIKNLHPEWNRGHAISTASSVASFYEEQNDQFDTATEDLSRDTSQEEPTTPQGPPSLRNATVEPTAPRSGLSREEILLEFIQTEETFLANTQLCIDFFILPIRTENSRSWIGGVPPTVSRLLDWFEDIVNLHAGVYQSLESSSAMQGGDVVVAGLANYLHEFVGKLHVYQPYLVTLSDILEEISRLVTDGNSDFGEFIRLQEEVLSRKGWTLEKLLMEPVNRLATYEGLFSDLLDSTPQDHPEFLTTLMLSRSAGTVMKAMTEVKLRETEHRLIQSLASQLSDPALSGILTSRNRRLLHSGTLRLVSPSVDPSAFQQQSHQARAQKRSSRLVQAITQWDRSNQNGNPERSGSLKSTASSVKSFNTVSSIGPPPSLDSRSAKLPLLKGLFKGRSGDSRSLHAPEPSCCIAGNSASVPPDHVQVFVFSDIVLMVLQKVTVDAKYNLVPKLGLARVFSVSASSSSALASGEEITIQLIAANADSIKNDTLPRSACLTNVVLELPASEYTDSDLPGPGISPWISAFETCAHDTAQLLSCPGSRKTTPSPRAQDTWLAVSNLVSSGLPIPKSPSGQLPDLEYGPTAKNGSEKERRVEREERGWWTLRYQEVLGELVHQNPRGCRADGWGGDGDK